MNKLSFLILFFLVACSKSGDKTTSTSPNNNPTPIASTLVEFRDAEFNFGKIEAGVAQEIEIRIKARSSLNGSDLSYELGNFNLSRNECSGVELISGDLCSIFIQAPNITLAQPLSETISLEMNGVVADTAVVKGSVINAKPENIVYTVSNNGYNKKILKIISASDRFGNPVTDLITVRANKLALQNNNLIRSNFSFPFVENKEIEILAIDTQNNASSESISITIESLPYSNGKFSEIFPVTFTNNSPFAIGGASTPCTSVSPTEITCLVEVNMDSFFTLPSYGDTETPNSLRYRKLGLLSQGNLSECLQNNSDLTCRFSPALNEITDITFNYTANDAVTDGPQTTVTLKFNIDNPPVAVNKVYSVTEDVQDFTPLEGSTSGFIQYQILSFPSKGTLQGVSSGIVPDPSLLKYIPSPNKTGADIFTYRVNDGTFNSNVATVSVNILEVNDPPVANNLSVTTDEEMPVNLPLNYSDIEDTSLTFEITQAPSKGVLSGTAPNLVYQPNEDEFGTDSFVYQVTDSGALTSSGTVSININSVNDQPIADDQSIALDEDSSIPIVLSGSDKETAPAALSFEILVGPTKGVLSGTAPNLTYTAKPNLEGSDSFKFRVLDANGLASQEATVSIEIASINDAPTTANINLSVQAGVEKNLLISANDIETPVSSMVFQFLTSPQKGIITGSFPNFLYTPRIDEVGQETLNFEITDEGGLKANGTASIYITNPSIAPVAQGASISASEDIPQSITLIGTENGNVAPNFSYIIVSSPTKGVLIGTPPNITYIPTQNYNGTDSFSFKVRNTYSTESAPAMVSINIAPVNDLPQVSNLALDTDEEASVGFSLSYSDLETTFNNLTFTWTSTPLKGSVSGVAPNFTYTPNLNQVGEETLDFTVSDQDGGQSSGQVIITINDVNDAPTAADLLTSVLEGNTINFNLPGSDIEEASSALTYVILTNPTKGSLSMSANVATYTSTAGQLGQDSFTYKVIDASGAESNVGTITIDIDETNRPPIANNKSVQTQEETVLNFSVEYSDSLSSFNDIIFEWISTPSKGTLSGTTPNFTYTPNLNATGLESLSYRVTDEQGLSSTGVISITIIGINDAPSAIAQSLSTSEDISVALTLSGDDVESSPSELIYTISQMPANGALKDNQNNTINLNNIVNRNNITYTPNLDYNGSDSFKFIVSDGQYQSEATINISISALNDAPRPANDSISVDEDVAQIITLIGNDPDNSEAEITFTIESAPNLGILLDGINEISSYPHTLSGSDITYVSNENENGDDAFTYTASDGLLSSSVARIDIQINPINDAPVGDEQELVIIEVNGSTSLNINGSDPETGNFDLIYTITQTPTRGVLSGTAPNILYTANPGEVGFDVVKFIIEDPEGLQSPEITIEILIEVPLEPSIYFSGTTTDGLGSELRKWDLDLLELSLVNDFNPGAASSNIQGIEVISKRIYISMDNGLGQGVELYRYSDSTNTKELLADINPGAGSSNPRKFIKLKNRLYFIADDGSGDKFYKFNPIDDSLSTINMPGISDWNFAQILNNQIYFAATNSNDNKGVELYRYDPEVDNVFLVKDLLTGATSSNPKHLTALNGKLYFFYDQDLINGVSKLFAYNPFDDQVSEVGGKFWELSKLGHMNNANNELLFLAQEKTFPDELDPPVSFNGTFSSLASWTTNKASIESNQLKLDKKIYDNSESLPFDSAWSRNLGDGVDITFGSNIGSDFTQIQGPELTGIAEIESSASLIPGRVYQLSFNHNSSSTDPSTISLTIRNQNGDFVPGYNEEEIIVNDNQTLSRTITVPSLGGNYFVRMAVSEVSSTNIVTLSDFKVESMEESVAYANIRIPVQANDRYTLDLDYINTLGADTRLKVIDNNTGSLATQTPAGSTLLSQGLGSSGGKSFVFTTGPSTSHIVLNLSQLDEEGSGFIDNIVLQRDPVFIPAPNTGSEMWKYSLESNSFMAMDDSGSSGSLGVSLTSSDTVDGKLYGFFTLPDDNKGSELYSFDPNLNQYDLVSELISGASSGGGAHTIFIYNSDFTLTPDQANFSEMSASVGVPLNYTVNFTLENILDTMEVINISPEISIDPASSCLNSYPYSTGSCQLHFSLEPRSSGSNQEFSLDIGPSYSDDLQKIKVEIDSVN